jgi:hypothetical protein
VTESKYSLASFRNGLPKLRAKGLVEKIPHSRRYRPVGKGYSICVAFSQAFRENLCAPDGRPAGTAAIVCWRTRNVAHWTACTSASAMIWMRSYGPSASKTAAGWAETRTKLSLGPYHGK